MAGDWIKFECNLPEKPEVLAITAILGMDDPDTTVGKLMRLFRWFDQHTTDGNAPRVTPALLDRAVGVTGLTQALIEVGWLHAESTGLRLEKFDRHNGATAKSRAQTAKRVANHRGNADGNAATVTAALAREREEIEKRKKEEKASRKRATTPDVDKPEGVAEQTWADWLKLRANKRAAVTETVLTEARAEASKAGVSLQRFLEIWCMRGSQGLQADWLRADERGPARQPAPTKFAAAAAGVFGRAPQPSEVIDV
jgi:hypothetical protein